MMEKSGGYANGKSSEASMSDLGSSIEAMSGQVAEVTHGLSVKAMGVMKQYPLHTALAAAGVGFVVGALVSRK